MFSDAAQIMIQILTDTDTLLASDSHFLLGHWIENAKSKATNLKEIDYYEWNARLQLTLWGENYTEGVRSILNLKILYYF